MRFSGQGMMSHTATTTVSRYFTKSRGRALSICWFGLSSAEFIMPVLMVFLLSITTWQNIWTIIAIIILFFLPIASFFLVKKVNLDTREKTEYKKGHISQAILHDALTTKKIDFDEVVVYDKDEMTTVSSAEKISKSNSIKVFYLEGGIQSWTENNLPLVEGK